MSRGRTAAIVPAAGRGERLGPGAPKALRQLAGAPLLVHAVRALVRARAVDLVVVAAPPDDVAGVRRLLASLDDVSDLEVVPGGATRQDSVRAALSVLPPDVDVVLVHDAARPLVPVDLVNAVAAAVRAGAEAVVPVLPVTDTIREVDPWGRAVATPDRSALRSVQTPQGFRRSVLENAHVSAGAAQRTDDAGLVEQAGGVVHVIAGSEEAFKVTRPLDLLLAEAVLARRRAGVGGDRAR